MVALANAACIRIERRETQKFELIGGLRLHQALSRPCHRFAEGNCSQMENTPSTPQHTMNSQGERRKNISDL